MNISEYWLRSLLDFSSKKEGAPDLQTIVDALTMGGLEVDSVASASLDFSAVVVGEIESVEQHPNADKLRVCQVKGHPEQALTQVVCGAPNARPGIKIPFALVGALLPEKVPEKGLEKGPEKADQQSEAKSAASTAKHFKIKKAKLRDVESFGMLCGADELGLEDNSPSSKGIWELPQSLKTGENLRDALELDDSIIEVDLTPNRSDCLSVHGIARDLAVLLDAPLLLPEIKKVKASHSAALAVNISAPDHCAVYAGRLIKNIQTASRSPLWMQERLRKAGIRSIDAVVDVTNYVMIELGQPLHAFDAAQLGLSNEQLDQLDSTTDQGVNVRLATNGEKMTLLNDQEVALQADNLLIASQQGEALALAGIMGGENSGVSESTRHIFLESAHFRPASIAGKARRLGLHTDASHRFERGVDPALVAIAIERATELLIEIAGGEPGPVVLESSEQVQRREVELSLPSVEPALGFDIPKQEVVRILTGLGCEILEERSLASKSHSPANQVLRLAVPTWRFDLAIEADLIEELARVYGFDRLPSVMPKAVQALSKVPELTVDSMELRRFLSAKGLREAITYSFIDRKSDQAFFAEAGKLLLNPISDELSVLRQSLIPGLVQAAARNLRRQQTFVGLFELGMRFLPEGRIPEGSQSVAEGSQSVAEGSRSVADGSRSAYLVGGLQQEQRVAFVLAGTKPSHWRSANGGASQKTDNKLTFFDAKGIIESWLEQNGTRFQQSVEGLPEYLHPGQSLRLLSSDGECLGVLGKLHPRVAKTMGIARDCFVFEAPVDGLLRARPVRFSPLSDQPGSKRDLALLADKALDFASIEALIHSADSQLLEGLELFDVYEGDGVAEDKRSLAVSLNFRAKEGALKDAEVTAEVDKILAKLADADVVVR